MTDWESFGEKVWEVFTKATVSTGTVLVLIGCFVLLAAILQLTTMTLRRKWFDLLGERSWTVLAAPGTIVHETGHALFCLIFRHRIVEIKLFSPSPDGTLGYVNHSWDPKSVYQRTGNFFIGTGPIVSGALLITLATMLLMPEIWEQLQSPVCCTAGDMAAGVVSVICRMLRVLMEKELWTRWQSYVWLLLILLIGSHMTLSRSDLKNAGSGAVLLPIVIFIISLVLVFVCDPVELVMKYGNCVLVCAMALMIFIIIVLGVFTLLLSLPVFHSGKH